MSPDNMRPFRAPEQGDPLPGTADGWEGRQSGILPPAATTHLPQAKVLLAEALSFLLALIPAGYALWRGARLMRHVDDPAFPELLQAGRRWGVFVLIFCGVGIVTIGARYAALKIALALLAFIIASYPARRRIYEESWSLAAYLRHSIRLWVAFLGQWILLALLPTLIRSAEGWAPGSGAVVAAALVVAALAWVHFNARVFAAILGARPLDRADLWPRFERVLARADCRRPRVLWLETHGGRWANALAVPGADQPAVVFTAPLLNALTAAEIAAIFAHEVAHLEYFHPRRLLRRKMLLAALTLALLAVVLTLGVGSGTFAVLVWAWPLILLFVLVFQVAGSQGREHASDLRALELTSDPEALISGLTRIHEMARLPRRWAAGREGRVSHPSLADRVRAIREAAVESGLALRDETPMPDVVVRSAGDAGEVVLLCTDRLHWFDGADPVENELGALLRTSRESRSLRYEDLADLRLEARGARRDLVAALASGERLTLPLDIEDVSRVKAALERLDLRVRGTSPEVATSRARAQALDVRDRILACLGAIVGLLTPFSLSLSATAILALARPARITLLAAGAVALTEGALYVASYGSTIGGAAAGSAILLLQLALGTAMVYEARARARRGLEDPRQIRKAALALLSGLAALYLVLLAAFVHPGSPLPLMHLHLGARARPGLVAVLAALAVCLPGLRRRRWRVPALTAAAAAAALTLIGSLWFRDHYTGDTMLTRLPFLQTVPVELREVRRTTLPTRPFDLRISPSGGRLAAQVLPSAEDGTGSADVGFLIERDDGGWIFQRATDLAFVDDNRAVLLAYDVGLGSFEVRIVELDAPLRTLRSVALPPLAAPSLNLDAARGRWWVVGRDAEDGQLVVASSDLRATDSAAEIRRFAAPGGPGVGGLASAAGSTVVAVTSRFIGGPLATLALMLDPLSAGSVTEVWGVGTKSSRRLATTTAHVSCVASTGGAASVACAAAGPGGVTTLWSVDPNGPVLTPVGEVPDYVYDLRPGPGDRWLLRRFAGPPLAVDPRTRRALVLGLGGAAGMRGSGPTDLGGLGGALFELAGATSPTRWITGPVSSGREVVASASRHGPPFQVTVYRVGSTED